MKKLLIGSAYASGTWGLHFNQSWFTGKTTQDYDFVVAASECPPFPCAWVQNDKGHPSALRLLADAFEINREKYEYALVLDSDAFPINPDWQSICEEILARSDKMCVCPIRTENCDFFPHPSFVFFRMTDLDDVRNHFRKRHGRTASGGRRDLMAGMPVEECFPLLKSNYWSAHPLMHSIYGGIVYHRGAGTRNPYGTARMKGNDYWKTLGMHHGEDYAVDATFINRLLGTNRFNTGEYGASRDACGWLG
jgi:hypothetical protein